MDLVICNTPLQVMQIEQLIADGVIKKNNFQLIFFVYNETEKLIYYYDRLSKLTNNNIYYKYQRFPFYVFTLRSEFKKKSYNNVYTASIDNKLVHYILSFVKFNSLYTIDDGTANIWRNSIYYIKRKNFLKSSLHFIFGCKFNLQKTKESIKLHYTIYQGVPNIIENTSYNNIFPYKRKQGLMKKEEINIFLGTVYSEVTCDKDKLLSYLEAFFKNKEFYYITHPRDNSHYFKNVSYIENHKVSEEIIARLLEEYNTVNIYGFGSSVQFNLAYVDGVNNYQLISSILYNNITIPGSPLIETNLDYYYSLINHANIQCKK
ncbi:glycosyltransferase family 52 [Providencia heimbachae]|uniref:glycosyltransferase family 52 n=1 Tax=Providencia TaxID=586 RepID=UPI0008398891|nr:glycosyltransferase family 52 [Providencia heimbachae]NIH23979.1 hypothetical protein [Providencia heimbachae]